MAFDGITIANIVQEIKDCCLGGRLYKIAQPEKDELLLTIKNEGKQIRLLVSINPSLPLLYLTENNKQSPMVAPTFCMLLRKHLQNAKITSISQPKMERIVRIELEHLDEMGDLCKKILIIELMGKHSNLIFCNEDEVIIDSIKRISGFVSSVREVLPGKPYFIAGAADKKNVVELSASQIEEILFQKADTIAKAIYSSFNGFSPMIAQEICYRSKIDGDGAVASLSADEKVRLCQQILEVVEVIKGKRFTPCVVYRDTQPIEYAGIVLTSFLEQGEISYIESMSLLIEKFYEEKSIYTRIRQKSIDLRKIVQTSLERNIKKYDLQILQMRDTGKKEKFRVYGELLNTYGYQLEEGATFLEVFNYYTNEMIKIPLDITKTPLENAQKYFDKYGKMKRTYEMLEKVTKEVKADIEHLESISNALDIALSESDLAQIKQELVASGYIKQKGKIVKERAKSKPFHYISSDGYNIYVGKNNFQNEEITFQLATGGDWWFHAKAVAGSHVIVKTNGEEMPDRTFEEAAQLAAYYSKAKNQGKVEVDYIQRKHVKKPAGAKPGFVIYQTNYSMAISPTIDGLKQVE